jgi:hypothetical protein
MERSDLQCEMHGLLAGTRNVHLRLMVSAIVCSFAAVLLHNRAPLSWIAVTGVTFLAVGAGLSTLWSP